MSQYNFEDILDNKFTSYSEKYQFLLKHLSDEYQNEKLIAYLKGSNHNYIYDFFHHSHKGDDLMPLELFWLFNQNGLIKYPPSVESTLFASSFQEYYNPISIYLIENYHHYQDDLNLFTGDEYNIYLFNHFFLCKNMPLIHYVLDNFEHSDIASCFEKNMNSYYSNPLSLIIAKRPAYFIEKMHILEQFNINLNQYLFFDLKAPEKNEERYPVHPFLITPLTLAKEVHNQVAIDYFTNHPNYQLGEYKQEFQTISYQDYHYNRGSVMSQILNLQQTMNEKARIELSLTKTSTEHEKRAKL
jgi:hypothetical protein